jgi:hypothetical protein
MQTPKAALVRGALAVLVLAACDRHATLSENTELVLEPDHLDLYMDEVASARAELLRNGRSIPGEGIVYWSDNTTVATVTPGGLVSAALPGSTWVRARYGPLVDSTIVTVRSDTRDELKVLDFVTDEVQAATLTRAVQIRYVALDGFGRTRCAPYGFTLRMDVFIARASVLSTQTGCLLEVTPGAEGETWVVASVQGLSDSVLVKVRDGAFQAQFTDSTVIWAVAGVPIPMGVRMLDPRLQPTPGQTVWFTASSGLFNPTLATTDASGIATVWWTPQAVLGARGGTGIISFRTLFPTGTVAQDSRTVPLQGGDPVRVEWFAGPDGRIPVGAGSLTAALRNFVTLSAAGRDLYGNQTPATPVITYRVRSGAPLSAADNRGATCGENLPDPNGVARYQACFASYRFRSDLGGTLRVYASFAGGPRDSLDVTFH